MSVGIHRARRVKRFFPFVFTLFFFVLMGNLLGLLPYSFTYTSHIAVTFGLALMVIVVVTVRRAAHPRDALLHLLLSRAGAPKLLAPLIIPIEVISYLSRPVSLCPSGLFANMVAGHVMFEVFATFVVLLAGAGVRSAPRCGHPADGVERGAGRLRAAGRRPCRPMCSPS